VGETAKKNGFYAFTSGSRTGFNGGAENGGPENAGPENAGPMSPHGNAKPKNEGPNKKVLRKGSTCSVR